MVNIGVVGFIEMCHNRRHMEAMQSNGFLERKLKKHAEVLGFDLVGITSAKPFLRDEQAGIQRIRGGLMDGLTWYTEERVRKAAHPTRLLEGASSVISLAMSYLYENAGNSNENPSGKIARYARGSDYHSVLKSRLKQYVKDIPQIVGHPVKTRIFVDDGPMMDRAAAERAGIGWFGKNTNIITRSHGSWVLLGQVITDLSLSPDVPLAKNCGECVRCIVACPTDAIVAPYVIDNKRCISFLTIELRGVIPKELRSLMGDWVFGCDICQDVCPPNWRAERSTEPAFQQRHDFGAPALMPLLELDDEGFSQRFKGSPIKRAKRVGLQRNVCVALGNIGDPVAIDALARVLRSDESILRIHAAWALGKIGGSRPIKILIAALRYEKDKEVADELEEALLDLGHTC